MHELAAKLIRFLYALCACFPVQNKITLFSRQGRKASLDFSMLAEALGKEISGVKVHLCLTDPESVSKKAFLTSLPTMIYHAATSRICILEGYIPAVSIPTLRKETCVVQLWHALGAIKKFGFQSVGTAAGRSVTVAATLGMHKNYDWIIAAGPGAVPAYAEAFGYDASKIKVLGMPRIDYLRDTSADSARNKAMDDIARRHPWLCEKGTKVLYVPTLRQNKKQWMAAEVNKLVNAFKATDYTLIVAGHPLEANEAETVASCVKYVPGVKSIDLLEFADYVITDYSAIAFEAAILGKPVFFYVPDIEQYRESPGLNIDPLVKFPERTAVDACDIANMVQCHAAAVKNSMVQDSFLIFVEYYFAGIENACTERLVSFIKECYHKSFRPNKGNSGSGKGEAPC